MVGRTLTKRHKSGYTLQEKRASVEKTKISAPIALLSTTNMLTYTAPNLRTSISTGSLSSSGSSTHSRSPTMTSWDDSGYSSSSNTSSPVNSSPSAPPAAYPMPVRSTTVKSQRRVPSEHDLRRTNSRKVLHSASQLPTSRQSAAVAQHPFEVELAKVAEMTEELGVNVVDAEEEFMTSHGLQKWRASQYEAEIWSGVGNVFEDRMPAFNSGWI